MKKTLIALMALAGVAMADNDFTVTKTNNWWAASVSGLSFEIEKTDVLSTNGYILAAFGGNAYGGTAGANILQLVETNGAITLKVGVGDIDNEDSDDSILAGTTLNNWHEESTRTKTFDTTISRDVEYTITGTGTNQSLTLTLSWEGGSTSVTYNGNVNGSGDPIAKLNANYRVVSTAAVPEPATATLSLLALCGLCARRRRA
ncbi:MAG: PEP-CTERM sorting domain-containing protein [Akkermansia sp.]|nr:PEP-CTERM sorting domain-containing protein [Akkermansia sp.]